MGGQRLADRAVKILGNDLAVEVDDLDLYLIRCVELLQGVGVGVVDLHGGTTFPAHALSASLVMRRYGGSWSTSQPSMTAWR